MRELELLSLEQKLHSLSLLSRPLKVFSIPVFTLNTSIKSLSCSFLANAVIIYPNLQENINNRSIALECVHWPNSSPSFSHQSHYLTRIPLSLFSLSLLLFLSLSLFSLSVVVLPLCYSFSPCSPDSFFHSYRSLFEALSMICGGSNLWLRKTETMNTFLVSLDTRKT